MTAEERIVEVQKSVIPARLLKGAAVLGDLWRSGARCVGRWSVTCPCEAGKETLFCQTKERWVGLFKEAYRDAHQAWTVPELADLYESDPYFIIKAMTVQMFEATGLTATISIPGTEKPIKIGPKTTSFGTLISLAEAVAGGAPLVESWNEVAMFVEAIS